MTHKLFKSQLRLSVAVEHLSITMIALAVGIAFLKLSACVFYLLSFISQTNLRLQAWGPLKSVYLNDLHTECIKTSSYF